MFTGCCGYAESLAVDVANQAQLAFWSNATAFPNEFVYELLELTGAPLGAGRGFGAPHTVSHDDSVPLVADGRGDIFMGWAGGYPTSTSFVVNTFIAGHPVYSSIAAAGRFSGADPHMALAVDSLDRVWAVWSQNGAVHARRSRSSGRHFGAPTSASTGGATVYQLAAIARTDGRVDVFENTGTGMQHQLFVPGLTVRATTTTTTVRVTDDGFGVQATVKGGGRTFKTSASGSAKLTGFKRGTRFTASVPGYAPASFEKP